MRPKSVSITELPPSPDAERHSRMIKYAITQAIRVVCIVLVVVIHNWWALIPAAGAVFLPYFAVVAANNVRRTGTTTVQRPGAIVPVTPGSVDQNRNRRMIGFGETAIRCSAAGCTDTAEWRINWRNPRVHTVERVKVWLACDQHRDHLTGYLASRGFPVVITPVDVAAESVPDPA